MPSTFKYPDGTVLNSSALSVDDANTIIQGIVCGMLGVVEPETSPLVRVAYAPTGAPFVDNPQDDVCFFRCMPKEDPYTKIRDRFNWGPEGWGDALFGVEPYGGALSGNPALTEQWNYTNAWAVHFTLYGPNSYLRAMAIRSGMFQDLFTGILGNANLFPIPDLPVPVRLPEQFDAQWFERVDFEVEMYEFVTDTIARQTVVSAEIIVETPAGVVKDISLSALGWGAGAWGNQPFGT